jgi:hypothetical protein
MEPATYRRMVFNLIRSLAFGCNFSSTLYPLKMFDV